MFLHTIMPCRLLCLLMVGVNCLVYNLFPINFRCKSSGLPRPREARRNWKPGCMNLVNGWSCLSSTALQGLYHVDIVCPPAIKVSWYPARLIAFNSLFDDQFDLFCIADWCKSLYSLSTLLPISPLIFLSIIGLWQHPAHLPPSDSLFMTWTSLHVRRNWQRTVGN